MNYKFLNIPMYNYVYILNKKLTKISIEFEKLCKNVLASDKSAIYVYDRKNGMTRNLKESFNGKEDLWLYVISNISSDDKYFSTWFKSSDSWFDEIKKFNLEIKDISAIEDIPFVFERIIKLSKMINDIFLVINCLNSYIDFLNDNDSFLITRDNVEDVISFMEDIEKNIYELDYNYDVLQEERELNTSILGKDNIAQQFLISYYIYNLDYDVIFECLFKEEGKLKLLPLSDILIMLMKNKQNILNYTSDLKKEIVKIPFDENFKMEKYDFSFEEEEVCNLKKLFSIFSLKFYSKNMNVLLVKLRDDLIKIKEYNFNNIDDTIQERIKIDLSNKRILNLSYSENIIEEFKEKKESIINLELKYIPDEIHLLDIPDYISGKNRNNIDEYIKNNIKLIANRFDVWNYIRIENNKIVIEKEKFLIEYNCYLNKMNDAIKNFNYIDKTFIISIRNDDIYKDINKISKNISEIYNEYVAKNNFEIEKIKQMISFVNGVEIYNKNTKDKQPFYDIINMFCE